MNTSSSSQNQPSVTILGLGTMGEGMARRLLDQGFPVNVWNRSAGRLEALGDAGATTHADAGHAVAQADVIITMLPTADAVTQVMLQGGVIQAFRSGAVWAQMGTIGVEVTERLAAAIAQTRPDVSFVDAPVSGSRVPARTGQLIVLASGPDSARPILDPVFGALGQRSVWLGPAGRGSRMKLVLNTLLAFEIEAVAEVDALAARLGLPYEDLVRTLAGTALASGVEMNKLAKMESGDDSADFSLQWALKDLDLALAASGAQTMPVATAILERWRRLVADGHGGLDVSAARLGLNAA